MDVSNVRRIISEMKQKKLDFEEKGLIEDATPRITATDAQIEKAEKETGVKYPETYKTFLKEYSNGEIVLLGIEPMVSLGLEKSERTMHGTDNSTYILHFKTRHPEKESYIFPEKRYVKIGDLMPITCYDGYEISNSHWAFICDKEYPDNDYPVGYITQDTENIVCVLKNFETWLDVFWQGNKYRHGYGTNVIMLLYSDFHDLCDLREECFTPEDYPLYKKLREKYDFNFRKYGID